MEFFRVPESRSELDGPRSSWQGGASRLDGKVTLTRCGAPPAEFFDARGGK
jgi:hypothetical protein